MILFLDLKVVNFGYVEKLCVVFECVFNSGWFILGKEVVVFEVEWVVYCGVVQVVGVVNGFDVLVLVLWVFEVGFGDEVIVLFNIYVVSWLVVMQVGVKLVLVELDEGICNIDFVLVSVVIIL